MIAFHRGGVAWSALVADYVALRDVVRACSDGR